MIEKKIVETLVINMGWQSLEVSVEEAKTLLGELADYFEADCVERELSFDDMESVAPPYEVEEEDEDK